MGVVFWLKHWYIDCSPVRPTTMPVSSNIHGFGHQAREQIHDARYYAVLEIEMIGLVEHDLCVMHAQWAVQEAPQGSIRC